MENLCEHLTFLRQHYPKQNTLPCPWCPAQPKQEKKLWEKLKDAWFSNATNNIEDDDGWEAEAKAAIEAVEEKMREAGCSKEQIEAVRGLV